MNSYNLLQFRWISVFLYQKSKSINLNFKLKDFFSKLQLAREMAPHDVGYRRMKTFSVRANKNDSEAPRPTPEHLPEWIDAKGSFLTKKKKFLDQICFVSLNRHGEKSCGWGDFFQKLRNLNSIFALVHRVGSSLWIRDGLEPPF